MFKNILFFIFILFSIQIQARQIEVMANGNNERECYQNAYWELFEKNLGEVVGEGYATDEDSKVYNFFKKNFYSNMEKFSDTYLELKTEQGQLQRTKFKCFVEGGINISRVQNKIRRLRGGGNHPRKHVALFYSKDDARQKALMGRLNELITNKHSKYVNGFFDIHMALAEELMSLMKTTGYDIHIYKKDHLYCGDVIEQYNKLLKKGYQGAIKALRDKYHQCQRQSGFNAVHYDYRFEIKNLSVSIYKPHINSGTVGGTIEFELDVVDLNRQLVNKVVSPGRVSQVGTGGAQGMEAAIDSLMHELINMAAKKTHAAVNNAFMEEIEDEQL